MSQATDPTTQNDIQEDNPVKQNSERHKFRSLRLSFLRLVTRVCLSHTSCLNADFFYTENYF
jgi:hypothetical protein